MSFQIAITGRIEPCNEQLHRGHIVIRVHMYPSCIEVQHAGNIQNVPLFSCYILDTFQMSRVTTMYPGWNTVTKESRIWIMITP